MTHAKGSLKDAGSSGHGVRLKFRIELATDDGETIFAAHDTRRLPDLLAPPYLTTVLKRFHPEWIAGVRDPLFNALDAYRRELYERKRAELPAIAYPAEIDFMRDLRVLTDRPPSDMDDIDALAKNRAYPRSRPV